MDFKTVLAHLKSKIFSVSQPWWPTFFTFKLAEPHIRFGSTPGDSFTCCIFLNYFLTHFYCTGMAFKGNCLTMTYQ